MKPFITLFLLLTTLTAVARQSPVRLLVLGTIQDAGSPQMGCNKACCRNLFLHPDHRRKVVSLGIIDTKNKQTYLFEATPDMPAQVKMLKQASGLNKELPDAIFLTHAHIGHYTGLMYLGKEAANSKSTPVYVMPRMSGFLQNNAPWNQLLVLPNIQLKPLENEQPVVLSDQLKVTPVIVPHRDELSETVGYKITGPHKSVLFIPDINKWNLWSKDIAKEIASVDYAFIDGTFFSGDELQTRNIAEVPHPFIQETIALLKDLPTKEKAKVYFIHFNHTNPVLNPESAVAQIILKSGFHVAKFAQQVDL